MIRAALLASTLFAGPALAQDCVQVELVLLADVSSSMSADEKAIQREGYAAAFRHPDVLDAIMGGFCGAVAVQYVEFGTKPRIVADWTIIQTDEDAEAFASIIGAATDVPGSDSGPLTGLSVAMEFAAQSLINNGIHAERSIADVSADGGENASGRCDAPGLVRDKYATGTPENGWREITFNALPIIGGGAPVGTCDMSLTDYMEDFVRGGLGSFVIEANGVSDLPSIVRQKLVQEMT